MKDSIDEFIIKLEAEFDDVEPGSLAAGTEIRKSDWWSSMHALILIAFIDSEYDVQLAGEELRDCKSVDDVYQIIRTKTAG